MTLILRSIEVLFKKLARSEKECSIRFIMMIENWLHKRKTAACEVFAAFAKNTTRCNENESKSSTVNRRQSGDAKGNGGEAVVMR